MKDADLPLRGNQFLGILDNAPSVSSSSDARLLVSVESTLADPHAIRAKIERLYMASEGEGSPFGAQRWFAETARVNERTVRGWLENPQRSDPLPVHLTVIELLEEQVGKDALQRAEIRRREYYREKDDKS